MLKKIRLLVFVSLVFLISIEFVGAYSVSSNNNPGSAHTAGTGSDATKGTNWGTPSHLQAVRIRIFRGSTVVKSGYYSLATSDSGCYSSVTGTLCETSSYNYSSVTSTSGSSCSSSKTLSLGCIVGTNLNYSMYWSGGAKANGTYLDNYLKTSNYGNLKSLLEGMGYNNTNFNDDDVVIVEPVTSVICNGTKYFGTSTALMKQNVSYRGASGNVCGGSDANKDGYKGWTFSNVFKNMSMAFKISTETFDDSSYTGFGFFKYNVSDVGFELPKYYLNLNGYLDSTIAYNITGYGTADIYINGTRVADDVSDYYTQWPQGTTYEIKDINPASGKKYNGVHSGSLTGTLDSDKSVYLDFSTDLGSIKIKKTNSSNDVLAQLDSTTTVKFQLYSDSNCTTKVGSEFSSTSASVSQGTYYLKETQAKKGYHLPQSGEKWYCEAVTVTAGETNEIAVENKTECEYKFNANMTMKERIDLYNLIKSNYSQEFNGLLDMNNKTAVNACKNIPVTKTYTKNCLSAESYSDNSSNFSNTNVSMYTEKYGTYTFCLTKYNLVNNLGKTSFNDIKSGQAIISTSNTVATATLNRVCYNFGDANIADDQYNNFNYSNYIDEDASIDGTSLIKNETPSGTVDNKTITATYTLPVMHSSNKDGKVYYGYCPSGQYCKVLGSGIISKFNLRPGTYNLDFDIKLEEGKLGTRGPTSDCKYTVENELIDYNNNLSIEFRSVNTNSDALFLGKDGASDRKIGANWSSKTDRDFVLKTKNNSYNKNNEDPLYKITLTPQVIKDIRENNKGKTYDDYNMTCVENGTICISNYLTCLQNRGILQIKERKNIDKFRASQIACKY